MKKNTDHIVLSTLKPQMECKHCGAIQPFAYPVYLNVMLAMMKEWMKSHQHCKKIPDRSQGLEDSGKDAFSDLSDQT
jgi:hypothetical protein